MTVIIDDLLNGKDRETEVDVGGVSVPARALEALRRDGYVYVRPYRSEAAVSAWGKSCTGCFTQAQLRRTAQ